ncbi:RagB/SusD family nutrient uptake outer membrane protein [Hymenobacter sp.]|jgi:hypothetical protein|uniref:RagB/SusD family nutrient uptake outer membrane protein n=1 Tax=Hymenobacter sp. TaxID=1898978 RepID=UPI002EDACC63
MTHKKTAGAALLMLALTAGCTKDYLDLQPRDAVPTENFYQTATDALQATNAVYSQLNQSGMFNSALWGIGDVMSDNSSLGGGGADGIEFQQLDVFSIPTTNPVITAHWQRAYLGIGQANQVLTRVPAIQMDEAVKSRYLGEAEFLRALYYFYLVRGYGDVPLVLTPAQSPAEVANITRSPAAEVYAQIVKDLTDAITKLPASYTGDNTGRATKWAATALLAKVYLTQGDMTKAAEQARLVIAGSGKTLWPNYGDNFKIENENGQESIFEVQFKSGLNTYSTDGPGSIVNEFWGARFFGGPTSAYPYVVSGGGYGFNIPEKEFVDGYEAGDLRKTVTVFVPGDKYPIPAGFTVAPEQPASLPGSPFGFNVKKFFIGTVNTNVWDSGLNIPVLRLADVYLMLAEAVGPTTEGLDAINRVRRRAFGLPITTASSKDLTAATPNFKDAVIRERRYELAFEDERWYDLKRTGKLLTSPALIAKGVKPFNIVLPIPQSEINVNPNLVQNQGY